MAQASSAPPDGKPNDWFVPGAQQPAAVSASPHDGPDDWFVPPAPQPQIGEGAALLRGVTDPVGLAPKIGGVVNGALDWAGLNPFDDGSDGSFSGGYDSFVKRARQLDDAAATQHPVAYYGGKVASGLALGAATPAIFEAAPAAGFGARVLAGTADAGAQGAAWGGAEGFGGIDGSLADQLKGGARGAVAGLAGGVALGAPLSVAGSLAAARAAAQAAQPASADVVGALHDLAPWNAGKPMHMPVSVASNSLIAHQGGQLAAAVPVLGTRMVASGRQSLKEAGDIAGNIAADFGGGAAHSAESAGQVAKDALTKYSTKTSDDLVDAAYNKVDSLVNPTKTSPLNATHAAYNTINISRDTAALGEAGKFLEEGLTRPGGLTYDGIKKLRTYVGQAMKEPQTVGASVSMANDDLRNIYSALTTDLESAAYTAGGQPALAAWRAANRTAKTIAERRETLQEILGADNPAGIFRKIIQTAGSTGSQDSRLLATARAAMGKDAWEAVASAATDRLGRVNGIGDFSLDRFVTDFEKLSPTGRHILYSGRPELQNALEKLSGVVGKRFKSLKAFANPSGTGQTVGGLAGMYGMYHFGVALLTHPLATIAASIPAPILVKLASDPATVRAMTNWAKLYNAAATLGTGGRKMLQFSSRQFAAEVGKKFGLTPDRVDSITSGLLGPAGSPAAASEPDQQAPEQP